MISSLELEHLSGTMEEVMKDNGWKIKCMGTENFVGQMVGNMMEK